MDMIDNPNSHYEYIMESKDVESSISTKLTALDAMKTLDGWCTKAKASILIDLVYMTKPDKVVEIGVFGGMSLVPMAFAVKQNGKGQVFGIDPWSTEASIEEMEGANEDWWGSINHEAIKNRLIERIQSFGLTNHVTLIQEKSEDTAPIVDIDILHIDGNHSDKQSYTDVIKWMPLVKKGGFIIFDDISWGTTERAVKHLDEHCVKLGEYLGDNVWGIWVKP